MASKAEATPPTLSLLLASPKRSLINSPTIPATLLITAPIFSNMVRILSPMFTMLLAVFSFIPRFFKKSILSFLLNDPKIIS